MSQLSRLCGILNISHHYRPPRPVNGIALLFYMYVHTLQETQASTACYGTSFSFFCVDNVRTSQQTRASTACYQDSFIILCVYDVRIAQETRLRASTALLLYV
jgi:hypothetical protein